MLITGKIVIVDDEDMVIKTLKTLLKIEGFSNVNIFNDTDLALQHIKENPCDLIISDFIMPKMNGIEFLSKAKKIHPDTTQILLTGYADKENADLVKNNLHVGFSSYHHRSLYYCISLVSCRYVAALGNVFYLFWNLISWELSYNDAKRKNREQADGRSIAAFERKGEKTE